MSPKKSTPRKTTRSPKGSKASPRKSAAKSASTRRKVADRKKAKKATGNASRTTAAKPDEMAPDVLEFIQAIDDYKRLEGRPFPSWSEVLEVLKGLGYERAPR